MEYVQILNIYISLSRDNSRVVLLRDTLPSLRFATRRKKARVHDDVALSISIGDTKATKKRESDCKIYEA